MEDIIIYNCVVKLTPNKYYLNAKQENAIQELKVLDIIFEQKLQLEQNYT